MRRADHTANFVAALHLVIDLAKDIRSRTVAGAISLFEELPAALVERLVDPEKTCSRYLFADGAGDAPGRVEKGVIRLSAMSAEPAVEALADPVNRTEQDAAFAGNVRLVLEFERRLEGTGRTETDGPCQGIVGRLAVDVLMHSKAAINPGAVDLATLLIEPSDRWSHPLRTHPYDVDVVAEGLAGTLDIGHEKTV